MNRLLFLSYFLLPVLCPGQSYDLCMQVISASGGSGAQANYKVSWTVGEPVITTGVSAEHIVTQGFHQPDVCALVSTTNLDLEALRLEVFPNPTSTYLTIRFQRLGQSDLHVLAFDVLGNLVLQPKLLEHPEGTVLDTQDWAPGVYFLQIHDLRSKGHATLKVVRL